MGSDPDGQIWGQLILIIFLTLINAGFAAAEIAVVSSSRTRMQTQADKGDRKAAKLVAIMKDSSRFLATIQVGITFAGFFASASAATTLADRIAPIFGHWSFAHEAAVILVTLILSYFSLVFGELYPKQVALQKAERVAKMSVTPISWLAALMRPFVWLLSASTQLLMKLTPMEFNHQGESVTREEMVAMIENGRNAGAIDPDEYQMFEGIISLSDTMAREVMVPRTDAFMIDAEEPDQKAIDAILNNIYSRIPVYEEDKDHVIGIVHIKNLLKEARRVGFEHVKIESVMTEPVFVPETITVDALLKEMQTRQQQIAILLDEYGVVVGIVTIEDLLEEIVGDIDDESDQAEQLYTKQTEFDYVVSGRMPISEFNDLFKTSLDVPDVDTIAGYVLTQLGAIPSTHHSEKLELAPGVVLSTGKVEGSRLVNVHIHLSDVPTLEASKEVSSKETDS
ncbi:hemolysin [Lacticaseibacillus chiayiensis]|uniref:Hemolysin n=1 Tax=Lacticaseibacillus chiayiensis TaxID=2100821 RepID=A0A4Q1UDE4_9LACO|nr:hemolysin family protein [Lacticaseibacillus chiayiensis]RXT29671.1 hemolysin [Lacticaseibacillus chiayiensis]